MIQTHTYVLNLRRRTDRRRRMQETLPDGLVAEFTSDWDLQTDWRQMDSRFLKGFGLFPWQIESENPWWNLPMRKGEVACAIAHLNSWRVALASGEERYLFLEDDVSFVADFTERLRASLIELQGCEPPWDLLYLGREALGRDTAVKEGIVRPGYSFGAYAYMLTREGARKLQSAGYEEALIPVDEFLPAMYCNHPRLDVRLRFPKRIHAYALDPPIVPEVDEKAWGSDTESSSFLQNKSESSGTNP